MNKRAQIALILVTLGAIAIHSGGPTETIVITIPYWVRVSASLFLLFVIILWLKRDFGPMVGPIVRRLDELLNGDQD